MRFPAVLIIGLMLGSILDCCLCTLEIDDSLHIGSGDVTLAARKQHRQVAFDSHLDPVAATIQDQSSPTQLPAIRVVSHAQQQATSGQQSLKLGSQLDHSSKQTLFVVAPQLRSHSNSHSSNNVFVTRRRQLSQQLLQAASRSAITSSNPSQPAPAPTPPTGPIFLPPPTDYQPPPQPPTSPIDPPPSFPPPPPPQPQPPSTPSNPPANDPPSPPAVPAPSSSVTPAPTPVPEPSSAPESSSVPEPAPSSPSPEDKSPSQSPDVPESPVVVFESPSAESPSPVPSPKASPSTRPRRNIPAKPIDPQPNEELPDAVLEEAENSNQTTAADTPVIPAETVSVSMLLRGVTPNVFNTTYSAKLLDVVARVSGTRADQWTARGVTARLQDEQQQQQQQQTGSSPPSGSSISSSSGGSGRKLLQQQQQQEQSLLYATASILTANPMLVVYRLSQAPTADSGTAGSSSRGGGRNAPPVAGCSTELCSSLLSSGIPVDSSSIEVNPNFDSSFSSSSGSSPDAPTSNDQEAQLAYARQLAVIIVCSVAGFVVLLIIAFNSRRIIDCCAARCCGPARVAQWQEQRQQQHLNSPYDRRGPIISADADTSSTPDQPRISIDWPPSPIGDTTEVSKFMKKGHASDLQFTASSNGNVHPMPAAAMGGSTASFSGWMPSVHGFGHMGYQPFEAYQYDPNAAIHYPPQQQEFTISGDLGGHGHTPQQQHLREIIEHNMLDMEEDLAALHQQMHKFLESKHVAAAAAARSELIPDGQGKRNDAAASGSSSD